MDEDEEQQELRDRMRKAWKSQRKYWKLLQIYFEELRVQYNCDKVQPHTVADPD